jgi:hypothetical protein
MTDGERAAALLAAAQGKRLPNIRDIGLATLLITGVEKSQIASGRRSVRISQ